ncbi:MAG: MarR family transcriptional regulator [Thiobacillaceae bacterium]|nr:MarR family transcriptional regulator [Thiobacillaceae bacterium]
MKTIIRTERVEGFFQRGRRIARRLDQGQPMAPERIIVYEDPEDLARILTAAKIALFRAVKARPGSITDIAVRLGRDRSAVKRDLDDLVAAGLVQVEDKPHPGHGRRKEVRATAEQVIIEAVLA